MEEFKALLQKCDIPRDARLSENDEKRLAEHLYNALVTKDRYPVIKDQSSAEKRWVHERACALNVQSYSGDGHGERKDVHLIKDRNWTLAAQMTKDVNKNLRRKINKRRAKASAAKRMEKWRTECYDCGEILGAEEAFYHHSGMGPLCMDCIENDEEYDGLKWECKASFWY